MSDIRPSGETADDQVVTDPDAPAQGDHAYGAGSAGDGEQAVWTPDAAADAPAQSTWTRDGDTPATDTWTAEPAPRTDAVADVDAPDDDYVPGAYSTPLYDAEPATPAAAPTTVLPPADTRTDTRPDTAAAPAADAETVVVAPVAVGDPARQPIFVQAPEAPVARGNRAAAGAIGLVAALLFAILYLGVALGLGALTGAVTGETFVPVLLAALSSWSFWVPVVVFFLAFWLLGALINRGRWGAWVVFGLLVGVAAYAGAIAGPIVEAPFWTLTAREGTALVQGQLLAPLPIAAFVIGRELTIWFGAWVARRGRRVTELNAEAQREYERTLEAGPKLYAS